MPSILKEGQWSLKWDCCQRCKTTERPHCARGLCSKCYSYKRRRKGNHCCLDCGEGISPAAIRCGSCAREVCWERGVYGSYSETNHCVNCGAEISPNATYCGSCAAAARWEHGDYDGLSDALKAAWERGDFDGVHSNMYTEAVRHQRSEIIKAAHIRGAYDGVFQSPTSIEIQIAAALDIMGLEHQPQYRPDGYSRIYDEFVPPNTLIEIQGDYWHGPERPDNQKRDAQKAQWAAENGYELMEIWEHEIKERGAWAIIAQAFG